MRKIYVLLFGAMLSLAASAQSQSQYYHGDWHLDSLVSVDDDGYYFREVYSYNDAGLLTTILSKEFNGEVVKFTKSEMTYNEQGITKLQDQFRLVDGDYVLMSRSEVTEYSPENGMPMVVISSSAGSTPGAELKPVSKTVVTKFHGNNFEEKELYEWHNGDWKKTGYTTAEYNDRDLMVKLVEVTSYMGTEMNSETTYEYDSHGNVTKDVYTSMDIPFTITYTNEYDANDNLSMVTSEYDGLYSMRSYYFWSLGEGTGMRVMMVSEPDAQWYDLNGCRLTGRPSQKGIFIRDGKKFINK